MNNEYALKNTQWQGDQETQKKRRQYKYKWLSDTIGWLYMSCIYNRQFK